MNEEAYKEVALNLNIEVATIKAVDSVESGGAGFWSSGELVILYEPHIFWKELKKVGIDPYKVLAKNPQYKDVLYQKWKTLPYPKTSLRWPQIEKAAFLQKECAYNSASYGRFQIMGFHGKALGYPSSFHMVEDMKKSEENHLVIFSKFVKVNNLTNYLRNKDWAGFALHYNGAGYKANKYDIKLAKAYEKFK